MKMRTHAAAGRRRAILATAAGCLLLTCRGAAAQTLEEFGYGNMATPPTWSCLAVLVDFSDTTPLPETPSYWDDYVFDPGNQPEGVNAFFYEMSSGNFQLIHGGIIEIDVPASNRIANVVARMGETAATRWYYSNLVHQAMASGLFDFQAYDTKSPFGTVTEDELLLIFLAEGEGGAVRYPGRVQPPGSPVAFDGSVASSTLDGGFGSMATMTHELSHLLGAIDLYGVWGTDQDTNIGLSLMSGAVHHDPWHKLQFGWIQPRIRSMRDGGVEILPAAQLGWMNGPVILYDPARGTREFFILEYRTPDCSVPSVYEDNLPDDGVVIWHIYHGDDLKHRQFADIVHPAASRRWFECVCGAMVLEEYLGVGACPRNGTHAPVFGTVEAPRDAHAVEYGYSSEPAERFQLCSKCGCLFAMENQAESVCPADGGTHDGSQSSVYLVPLTDDQVVGHNNWRRCIKCESLVYGHPWRRDEGVCPADGAPHSLTVIDTYITIALWSHPTVMTRSYPDLDFAKNQLWPGDRNTPCLTWYDGTYAPVYLHIRPFSRGDDTVTVEWSFPGDTWVKFDHTGTENGTFEYPYNTMAEGLDAVPHGGTLHIFSGSTPETPVVTKRMRIEAYGGPVTIGR